ncbi:MAG: hypothetical protein HQ500_00735 [Flavobacteriales bacterium]|nr:hypothetical protein [Flavobacteriales bacterium]
MAITRSKYFKRLFQWAVLFVLGSLFSACSNSLAFHNAGGDSAAVDSVGPPSMGGLISTRFKDLDALKRVISIEFLGDTAGGKDSKAVRLTQHSNGITVVSELEKGVDEDDFRHARDNGFWAKVALAFASPYALAHRKDIMRVFILSRRKHDIYGPGDIAFYDFAELMTQGIRKEDRLTIPPQELTEKGYLNTFNHITAQAFVTTLFSEELAEYVAEVHERHNMPELISGKFTNEQLLSEENNPVDNYVDMINNEWGQLLGKTLKEKYGIGSDTEWTPQLLADYLNDVQAYYTWAFQISFQPFDTEDEAVVRFSSKLNAVLGEVNAVQAGDN